MLCAGGRHGAGLNFFVPTRINLSDEEGAKLREVFGLGD
jgi:hypothetical protein